MAIQTKSWFEVSKDGLKKLQLGKPKHYAIRELLQNAMDEDAQQTYSKTKTEESLHAVQEAEKALKVTETVYNKLLDDFILAMVEFIVEKEKAQTRKKG